MLINNPHLVDQKGETSRLHGCHSNKVTQVYLTGRDACQIAWFPDEIEVMRSF